MLRLIKILLLVLFVNTAFAQKTYQKIISLPHEIVSGQARGIVNTADGGYIFSGGSGWADETGNYHGYLFFTKVDPAGNAQWIKHQLDVGASNSMCQSRDSILISAGPYAVSSIDKNGNALWTNTFYNNQLFNLIIWSITATSDKCVVVVGRCNYQLGSDDNGFAAKLDSNGNTIWVKTFGTTYNDELRSVIETKDSGYLFTGTTYDISGTRYGVFLVKTDKFGNVQWSKKINWENHYNYRAFKCISTKDGGYAITGDIDDAVSSHRDIYIAKLDSTANLQWVRSIGGSNEDFAWSMIETDDSCLVVTGNYSFLDGYIVKVNKDGNLIWTRRIGGKKFDPVFDIIQAIDHSYLLVGANNSEGEQAGDSRAYIVKMDSSGYVCGGFESGGVFENRNPFVILVAIKDSTLTNITSTSGTPLIDHAKLKTLCEDGVLALQLLSFNASNKNGQNLLNWNTQQELNTKSFEVQRSTDGINFYKIGTITAKNNYQNNYSFTDVNPVRGSNYYRLRIIDNSGISTYSEIREVKNEGTLFVTILPNPVKGNTATLKISGQSSETISLFVINSEGKILLSKKVNALSNNSYETIDVSALSKGFYYLKVISGKEEKVVKFVRE